MLHLPSIHRGDLSMEERVDELARWSSATTKPDFVSDLDRRIREHLVIEWAQSVMQNRELVKQGTDVIDRVAALETERATLEARVSQLEDQLRWITNSRTWRFMARQNGWYCSISLRRLFNVCAEPSRSETRVG